MGKVFPRSVGWRTLTRLLHLLAVLIIVAAIATFAVFAVPQLAGAERSYVVLSGSMQPTMEPGDVILVDAVDVEAVEPGQIVTYRESANSVTTHRVVEKVSTQTGPALRTKGDDNDEPDTGLVRNEALVGRVMSVDGTPIVVPYMGHLVEMARTQLGVFALVFVPLTLFVLNEFYRQLSGAGSAATEPVPTADGGLDPVTSTHAIAEGNRALAPAQPATAGAAETADPDAKTADVAPIVPLRLRLPVTVLSILATYSAWMTYAHRSVIAAMVFAGSAVVASSLGYVHFRRSRQDRPRDPGGALSRGEVSLTLVGLLAMTASGAWFAVGLRSVVSAMVAAAGAIAVVLLGYVRLWLWWEARGTSGETAGGDSTPKRDRSEERGT